MRQYGSLYSSYYDLLYSEKDYAAEVEYIISLIKANCKKSKSLLDMGCGTGKHAALFCEKGFLVHGIDLSKEMLKIAESRRIGQKERLSFSHSSIQDLKLNKKFDIVTSLFHVMSYQNSNEELLKAFIAAKIHLNEEGVFIFDFWYGPAVLLDKPVTRVKRLENENIKVTRIAEPLIHADQNTVDVNYDIFIEDKKSKQFIEKKELHKMRFLFDTELEIICSQLGFEILQKYDWMSLKKPDLNSWNVVWVVKLI